MSELHDWAHRQRSKLLRAQAYANPATRCWRCKQTLAEVAEANPGRRVVWHAGHTGGRWDPLMAECNMCNLRHSAATTHAKVAAKKLATERITSGGTRRF